MERSTRNLSSGAKNHKQTKNQEWWPTLRLTLNLHRYICRNNFRNRGWVHRGLRLDPHKYWSMWLVQAKPTVPLATRHSSQIWLQIGVSIQVR